MKNITSGAVDQIMFWFQETAAKGEAIDLYGSIPCAPYSPLQQVNLAVQGTEYEQVLAKKRADTEILVDHFCQLSEVAVESGGSSSFEWPSSNWGPKQEQITEMIIHFKFSCSADWVWRSMGNILSKNGELSPLPKEWLLTWTGLMPSPSWFQA